MNNKLCYFFKEGIPRKIGHFVSIRLKSFYFFGHNNMRAFNSRRIAVELICSRKAVKGRLLVRRRLFFFRTPKSVTEDGAEKEDFIMLKLNASFSKKIPGWYS